MKNKTFKKELKWDCHLKLCYLTHKGFLPFLPCTLLQGRNVRNLFSPALWMPLNCIFCTYNTTEMCNFPFYKALMIFQCFMAFFEHNASLFFLQLLIVSFEKKRDKYIFLKIQLFQQPSISIALSPQSASRWWPRFQIPTLWEMFLIQWITALRLKKSLSVSVFLCLFVCDPPHTRVAVLWPFRCSLVFICHLVVREEARASFAPGPWFWSETKLLVLAVLPPGLRGEWSLPFSLLSSLCAHPEMSQATSLSFEEWKVFW